MNKIDIETGDFSGAAERERESIYSP